MLFDDLTSYFSKLESTSSRSRMYELLGSLFQAANSKEVPTIAYLCQAELLPSYKAVQAGMGDRMVQAAIAEATGMPLIRIQKLYSQKGDLGLVAREIFPGKVKSKLTVSQVHRELLKLARVHGQGVIARKTHGLVSLLRQASPSGAMYIVRIVLGNLRLGVGSNTIIEAVARLYDDSREARKIIERAYNLRPDLGLVLGTLRSGGLAALKRIRLRVGDPVRPMMAERLADAEAIINRLGNCAAESKIDGLRCQVHLRDRKVQLFSRNLESLTETFPEIARAASRLKARSLILDGEAITVDPNTGEFYPFQVTLQRKRKHGVERISREFPLALMAFDILYLNGKDLTGYGYERRRKELERIVKHGPGIELVDRLLAADAGELQQFFDAQVEQGLEGVVAKRLDAPYRPGERTYDWIKLKRNYSRKLQDTLDLVIVGYFRGRGRRARLGIGALLASVYDKSSDAFPTIAKIGSGLSDEQWMKLRELLDGIKRDTKPARVVSWITPDVWVEPRYVITVVADEITRSPTHAAGRDESGSGLALRFPRVVEFVREDKSPEDATTLREIEKMYRMQAQRKAGGA